MSILNALSASAANAARPSCTCQYSAASKIQSKRLPLRRRGKKGQFLSLNEAAAYLQEQKDVVLRSSDDFKHWSASPLRPKFIPSAPHLFYRNTGWINYQHFLGKNFRYLKPPGGLRNLRKRPANIVRGRAAESAKWINADNAYEFFVNDVLKQIEKDSEKRFEFVTYQLPPRSRATLLLRMKMHNGGRATTASVMRRGKTTSERDSSPGALLPGDEDGGALQHFEDRAGSEPMWIAIQLRTPARLSRREKPGYKFDYLATDPGVGLVLCAPDEKRLILTQPGCASVIPASRNVRRAVKLHSLDAIDLTAASETIELWWMTQPRKTRWDWIQSVTGAENDKTHHHSVECLEKLLYRPLGLNVEHCTRDGNLSLDGRRCLHRLASFRGYKGAHFINCGAYRTRDDIDFDTENKNNADPHLECSHHPAEASAGDVAAPVGSGALSCVTYSSYTPTRAGAWRWNEKVDFYICVVSTPLSMVEVDMIDSSNVKMVGPSRYPSSPEASSSTTMSFRVSEAAEGGRSRTDFQMRGLFLFPRQFLMTRCVAAAQRQRRKGLHTETETAQTMRSDELMAVRAHERSNDDGDQEEEHTREAEAHLNLYHASTIHRLLVYPPFLCPRNAKTKEKQRRQLEYYIDLSAPLEEQMKKFRDIFFSTRSDHVS